MRTFSALIVDDEELARNDLKNQLSGFSQVIIIGEADSLNAAVKLYQELKPDLIFLDIQLNNDTGFDLLNHIDEKTKIVFVTAYDEYAIKAFDVNAQDYLLKPVNIDRLSRTIDKLCETTKNNSANESRPLSIDDSIFLKLDNTYQFVKIDSIIIITSADDYSEVVTNDNLRKRITYKSLKEWEQRLPDSIFCRIHRSTIVNTTSIDRIEPWHNYSHRVYLKNVGKPVLMSRRYFSLIKERLG